MAMMVTKRDGSKQPVQFDKISERLEKLCTGLDTDQLDIPFVVKRVIEGLYDGVTTTTLDELASETCASLTAKHPDYGHLAARVAVSNLHKETNHNFIDTLSELYNYVDPRTGEDAGLINDQTMQVALKHKQRIQDTIDYSRDYNYDFFGFKTLERSYLLKMNGKIVERPQQMLMRVSIGIWGDNIDNAMKTYELLSQGYFTHATPTLFNAGTRKSQLSSCFLLGTNDSMQGIFKTISDCAMISKNAGGIGVHVSNIRAKGSYIKGTNGTSNGLVPMLRVYNNTARYSDQGGGRRKGAFAIYLEPWHGDILEWLDLKKNTGNEEQRCRDLFYGLWIPDLFMERVEQDGTWSLMSLDECPGLSDAVGDDFKQLYEKYEAEGKFLKQVKAREVWKKIMEAQIETGTPYMLYKDAANMKSNQQHYGTIKSSNLCCEIIEYSDDKEYAVCNLASIALPKFINLEDGEYDHEKLHKVVKQITRNMNRIIDINYYPVPETQVSNDKHRPIGLGVQGLADTFALLKMPFDSWEARELNREIFETIYHAAVEASMEVAQEEGHYETFPGSPASKGQLQFDLWGVKPTSGRYDWDSLKEQVKEHGLRNSLLLAPMPTASTSQILGNNECFEPFTSNIYVRRTLSGEYVVANKYLVRDLVKLGLWDENMRQQIIAGNGSVQHIKEIPRDIKDLYKTVWEISQKNIIDLAADRGAFICQSQSMNLFMAAPTMQKLTSMHFYAWKKGLKTGMYYLRSKAAAQAIQFTVEKNTAAGKTEEESKEESRPINPDTGKPFTEEEAAACRLDDPDSCLACGS